MKETNGNERKKSVTLDGTMNIPNIFALPKLGAGHDGIVYRYGDLALKLLKYDIPTRTTKNLMTFNKAKYFRDNLNSRRFTNPQGLMFDDDGMYCGYSMKYIEDITKDKENENYKEPSSFTVEDLFNTIEDLEIDTEEMTKNDVIMKDLNRGCYIFSNDFMRICDMDKFLYGTHNKGTRSLNRDSLNFIVAKFFWYEMVKKYSSNQEKLKIIKKYIVDNIKNPHFISQTKSDLEHTNTATIGEYLEEKEHKLMKL